MHPYYDTAVHKSIVPWSSSPSLACVCVCLCFCYVVWYRTSHFCFAVLGTFLFCRFVCLVAHLAQAGGYVQPRAVLRGLLSKAERERGSHQRHGRRPNLGSHRGHQG